MSELCDGVYAVYHERWRHARKSHVCSACRELVQPGHRYCAITAIYDRKVRSLKRCARCQAIHEHLRELGDDDEWPSERLDCGEEYLDHWGEDPPPEIAALAFWLPGEEVL